MSIESISAQLQGSASSKNKYPPVELWDPPYCGEIDLLIKADGTWFYNGTVFKRLSLVKLFASVLKKEGDDYFLVTPVEKVKITVEDAPYVLTQWHWTDETHSVMKVATQLDDEFLLDADHELKLSDDGSLYVNVRRNLYAKVHRNVYYQWVDLAEEVKTEQGTSLCFTSAGVQFCLGKL
jgi:hypothetical protein